MCDTLYKEFDNSSVFLKNSDRAANEPNLVVFEKARKANGQLKCTYITIPDSDAFACILCKPSWTWGAEMGVNQHGLAVGNEAVFTKGGDKKTQRLIGMDFVRLILERAKTAAEGVDIALQLLEKHGQGGNCGFDHEFFYDNSYLIADKKEGFVLETAGKEFAVKKIKGQGNISNRLSLEADADNTSTQCNFKKTHTEPVFTLFSGSKNRECLGKSALLAVTELDFLKCFDVLKTHVENKSSKQLFEKGSIKSLCVHAGILGDHTTGSMAVFWQNDGFSVWFTGTSTPCLSIFKPVSFSHIAPPLFVDEKQSFAYWLKREKLNRAIFSNWIDQKVYLEKADALQKQFVEEFTDSMDYFANCAKKEEEFVNSFALQIDRVFADNKNLAKNWRKRTKNLGKNVFAVDFKRYEN